MWTLPFAVIAFVAVFTFAPVDLNGTVYAATAKTHTVIEGEYLDKIASDNGTTWQTLHGNNTDITDPNLIYIDQKIQIPDVGTAPAAPIVPQTHVEVPRTAPSSQPVQSTAPAPKPVVEAPVAPIAPVAVQPEPVVEAPVPVIVSSFNNYEAGQCTWHVKNLRADLPNNLGNADQWYSNAQSQGLPTGTEPRVGAAAPRKSGMHVVYVKEVYGDGTILVSEMNYDYVPYNTREVIKNASDFYYIY